MISQGYPLLGAWKPYVSLAPFTCVVHSRVEVGRLKTTITTTTSNSDLINSLGGLLGCDRQLCGAWKPQFKQTQFKCWGGLTTCDHYSEAATTTPTATATNYHNKQQRHRLAGGVVTDSLRPRQRPLQRPLPRDLEIKKKQVHSLFNL